MGVLCNKVNKSTYYYYDDNNDIKIKSNAVVISSSCEDIFSRLFVQQNLHVMKAWLS